MSINGDFQDHGPSRAQVFVDGGWRDTGQVVGSRFVAVQPEFVDPLALCVEAAEFDAFDLGTPEPWRGRLEAAMEAVPSHHELLRCRLNHQSTDGRVPVRQSALVRDTDAIISYGKVTSMP